MPISYNIHTLRDPPGLNSIRPRGPSAEQHYDGLSSKSWPLLTTIITRKCNQTRSCHNLHCPQPEYTNDTLQVWSYSKDIHKPRKGSENSSKTSGSPSLVAERLTKARLNILHQPKLEPFTKSATHAISNVPSYLGQLSNIKPGIL